MNGLTRVIGDATLAGGSYDNIRVVGDCTLSDSCSCHSLRVVGELHARHHLTADNSRIHGTLRVNGNTKFLKLMLLGFMGVDGDFEAESLSVRGELNVAGLLNADKADFHSYGHSVIREMGGGLLTVTSPFWPPWKRFRPSLRADIIEYDEANLENVQADVLRGKNLVVGKHCRIGRVEYSGTLTVHKSAFVAQCEKVSANTNEIDR